jgi:hypothetical protein
MSRAVAEALKHARHSGTGWWRADCPLCLKRTGKADRKQALAINIHSGVYVCWKCQATGSIKTKGMDSVIPDEIIENTPPVILQDTPPPGYTPLAGDRSMSLGPARAYAAKRCPEERWAEVGIGACISGKYAGRVIVPVMTEDGRDWVGWVGRTWFKSDRAYSYPKGMNRGDVLYRGAQLWEHTDEPLIVVEGVFDALYMWPHGVALLGKASEYQMEALFESPRPVVIILDGDAWEEAYAMKLRLQLHGKKHVGHVRLPPKKDPDDMPRDWLAEEIRRAL